MSATSLNGFRRFHRVLGVVLILPFLGWVATGLFFFVKPGYQGAYESLTLKTLPLGDLPHIQGDPSWMESRLLRTHMGLHLLVKTNNGGLHLDPVTGQPRSFPNEADLRDLIEDAISANPQRYGEIEVLETKGARTSTGVEITLDWNRLALRQYGEDTRFIDRMYKIHYLSWTGVKSIDRVAGVVGLALVLCMTLSGVALLLGSKRSN